MANLCYEISNQQPYIWEESKLEWSRTRAKFCQLIAHFSLILRQLKLTKLKLDILKSDFQRKK